MIQIFRIVIYTSCVGSLLALILTIIKPLTNKYFSANWSYYMWILVLVTMLLPIKIALPINNDISEKKPPIISSEEIIVGNNFQRELPSGNMSSVNENFQSLKNKINKRIHIISYIWFLSAILSLCIKILSYILLLRKIRNNSRVVSCPQLSAFTHKKIIVRESFEFCSPIMIGVLKPTLLLPNMKISEEHINNILRHEIVHLKRHDILCKWLVMFVKVIHWFNPMIYYISRQINIECEISCDLAVTSQMNMQEEKSYVNTILTLLSQNTLKTTTLLTGMVGKKKDIKRRFVMIMNRKRISKITSVISVLFATVILSSTIFIGNVFADNVGIYDEYQYEVTVFGEKVEFNNKPYIENGVLYLPLRETLEYFIEFSDGASDISWNDNGEIILRLFGKDEDGRVDYSYLYYYKLQLDMPEVYGVQAIDFSLSSAPVLKNLTTYVPIEVIEGINLESGILNGFAYSVK